MHKRYKLGFTLVELMVVIAVIAILAAITVVSYRGVQAKSQDSIREHDMATIKEAILLYDDEFKGVPKVNIYNSAVSSWDQSNTANWLVWLRPDHGNMPVDPVNDMKGSTANADSRLYWYYCYDATNANAINGQPTVNIHYRDSSSKTVSKVFNVTNCLTTVPTL